MIIDEKTYLDYEQDAYLNHHGIKGMRWGVRNERKPSLTKQEKREKRAQKHDAEVARLTSQVNKLQRSKPTLRRNLKMKKLNEEKQIEQEKADARRAGKLSKKEKHQVAGATAVAAILATYATYESIQSGNATRLIEKGKNFVHHRPAVSFNTKPVLANKDLTADQIQSLVVKDINPGYNTGQWGSKMNCRRATLAYEMRRRGYDVTATHTSSGRGQNPLGMENVLNPKKRIGPTGKIANIGKAVKEQWKYERHNVVSPYLSRQKTTEPSQIFRALNEQPDGARGELSMIWKGGMGGHSMAWERIKGETVIFDTQTGQRYNKYIDMSKVIDSMKSSVITRLDDKPLNSDYLMRWVKNV